MPFGVVNNSQTDSKRKGNYMLDFVKKAFRNGIAVILWINLILSTIGGGIFGYNFGLIISYRNAGGYAFFGVIIGFICGLLIDIIGGGFITTILSIEKNTEEQTALLKKHFGISDIPEGILSTEKIVSTDTIATDYKVVVTQKTNIRKGPGEDELQLGVMDKDETIKVIRTENNWSCFIQDNGHEGWIHSSVLSKVE